MSRIVKWIILCFFLGVSCADEAPRFTIPFAPVNFRIDMNGHDHMLKNPLAYKIFTEKDRRNEYDRVGFSGLLAVSDVSGSSIFVYDLCCPFEADKHITVTPTSDGKAVCKTCGSTYITMYGLGTSESGPSKKPLQQYNVRSQSTGIFVIRN